MNGYLRKATAGQVRTIGPFVDSADFITPLNALTLSNTDILLKKNGASSGSKNSGGATADGSHGLYHLTWDATDTATVGELAFSVFESGALAVWGTYVVLEEAVYDLLFASGATGDPSGVTFPANFASLSIDSDGRVKALVGIQRNEAHADFTFLMTDDTLHQPKTDLANGDFTTKTVRIDGGAPVSIAGTITNIGGGYYAVDLIAAETDGKNLAFVFAAADSDVTLLSTVTSD
jgi:hypothetical protein